MSKRKRKLTAEDRAEKKRRRALFMTVFVRGKMKRVRRPLEIDGMSLDEFVRRNADPIWLHQNEMWEYMQEHDAEASPFSEELRLLGDDDIPVGFP